MNPRSAMSLHLLVLVLLSQIDSSNLVANLVGNLPPDLLVQTIYPVGKETAMKDSGGRRAKDKKGAGGGGGSLLIGEKAHKSAGGTLDAKPYKLVAGVEDKGNKTEIQIVEDNEEKRAEKDVEKDEVVERIDIAKDAIGGNI